MKAKQSFPLPHKDVKGALNLPYALTILFLHVLVLLALIPWLFSWAGLISMLVGILFFGQGINLCYHRILTHRSLKVPKWFEHIFVVIGLCCLQDTPARWVATHRYHHIHSDIQGDPHSPLVTFIWGHLGWLICHNLDVGRIDLYHKYARDILEDPFYMKLEKNPFIMLWIFLIQIVFFFLLGGFISYLMAGSIKNILQMALSMVVWAGFLRIVIVWHITWSVNSMTHLFGYRNYETCDNSRNNWLVGLFAMGEGWHNNHHHDPVSATVQHRWWELDFTYYNILLLKWIGLATEIIVPRHKRGSG